MNSIDCREKFSPRECIAPTFNIRNLTNLCLTGAIVLLTIFAPLCLGACMTDPFDKPPLGRAHDDHWEIGLSPSAGSGASASVELLEDFGTIFPEGNVTASLSSGGTTLIIDLNGGSLPAGASGELALITVEDSVGEVHSVWRMTAGGGNVIVVLVDD